ncbi:MAG: class I SAM-dependent methyltransferase [Bacteroidia bacterium]|nr:class I SAM-dependent methyltransferase [Bacteroidia bacterium]
MTDKIINGVKDYYTQKIKENGVGAKGVDWNSKESQYLRFKELCGVIKQESFTILDYGCGYGELINYLNLIYANFQYTGFDISEEMLSEAYTAFSKFPNAKFINEINNVKVDYVIGSGLFNVKLNLANEEEWQNYILNTLREMDKISNLGFSFNALTKYSDKEFLKDYLFYSDPLILFDYCKRNFSKNVALLHDYDLYEFTIIVRKDG